MEGLKKGTKIIKKLFSNFLSILYNDNKKLQKSCKKIFMPEM